MTLNSSTLNAQPFGSRAGFEPRRMEEGPSGDTADERS